MAERSPGPGAEALDDETTDDETTGVHATGAGVTGTGVIGADVTAERRPGEPRAPLSPAGPPVAAAQSSSPAASSSAASSSMPSGSPASAAPADGEWAAILAQFVDDPRRAVEQAADATSAALDQLLETARGHEATLRRQWQDGSADTEELRTALRGYREFAGRIAGLARDF
jgi:hypothetical protein